MSTYVPRAQAVGSLLRPERLKRARDELNAGTLTPAAFKRIEDAAVDEAIATQKAAGLEELTDGEMRRGHFTDALALAVDGVEALPTPEARASAVSDGGAGQATGRGHLPTPEPRADALADGGADQREAGAQTGAMADGGAGQVTGRGQLPTPEVRADAVAGGDPGAGTGRDELSARGVGAADAPSPGGPAGDPLRYTVGRVVAGRLRRRRSLALEEFVYARARAGGTAVKQTLPSPLMMQAYWSPEQCC